MILTYKYRIKDNSARKVLRRHAYAVNQVWNYCVGYQRDIQKRYRAGAPKRRWPTHFELTSSTKGCSKELGIHAQTVQNVCHQFSVSRNQTGRAPRFRASVGSSRALGWVPFQKQSRQVRGNSIFYRGRSFRFFQGGRPLPETAKGGAFVEDTLGRWYVCFQVEVAEQLQRGDGMIGIRSEADARPSPQRRGRPQSVCAPDRTGAFERSGSVSRQAHTMTTPSPAATDTRHNTRSVKE